jgi:hypothetical protein
VNRKGMGGVGGSRTGKERGTRAAEAALGWGRGQAGVPVKSIGNC